MLDNDPDLILERFSTNPFLISAESKGKDGTLLKENQTLWASRLIYSPTVPEYPICGHDGTLYVISSKGISSTVQESPWKEVTNLSVIY